MTIIFSTSLSSLQFKFVFVINALHATTLLVQCPYDTKKKSNNKIQQSSYHDKLFCNPLLIAISQTHLSLSPSRMIIKGFAKR